MVLHGAAITALRLPRPPAAVIFDMDGLLFDSERLYEQATLAAAAALSHEMSPAFFRSTVGSSWPAICTLLLNHYGPAFATEELRLATREHFNALCDDHLPMKPGVLELLDLLDELRLPRAIATTSAHGTVQRHLKAHGLGDRFDHVVAAGDYARHKPAPDPYLMAADRLAVAPERCLALEDSYNGVRAASAAGMMTIMVPDLLPPTDEIKGLCLLIASDLHEVRGLIAS